MDKLTIEERLVYLRGFLLGMAGRLEELACRLGLDMPIAQSIDQAGKDCRAVANFARENKQ